MKTMMTDIELKNIELKGELKSTDITLDLLNKLQEKAIEVWKDLIPRNLINVSAISRYKMILDKRPTMRAGQCRYNKKEIGISPNCLHNHTIWNLKNTVAHEVLHSIFPKDNHGGKWKQYADKFNRTLHAIEYGYIKQGYKISKATERKMSKYEIKCPNCGNSKLFKNRTSSMNLSTINNSEDIRDVITFYFCKPCNINMTVSRINHENK